MVLCNLRDKAYHIHEYSREQKVKIFYHKSVKKKDNFNQKKKKKSKMEN